LDCDHKHVCSKLSSCRTRLFNVRVGIPPGPIRNLRERIWHSLCLDRVLVEFFFREGEWTLFSRLMNNSDLFSMVEYNAYKNIRRIVQAIRTGDYPGAVSRCDRNQASLNRRSSRLEFQLQYGKFLQLVRLQKFQLAVAHARRHLCHWSSKQPDTLQQLIAFLAFSRVTCRDACATCYARHSLTDLGGAIFAQSCSFHSLQMACKFVAHVQAGLSCLQFMKRDPVCIELSSDCDYAFHLTALLRVAKSVPATKHTRSMLVCHVTRGKMDETNPPQVMPNGSVYSAFAIKLLARSHEISCPRTSRGPYVLSDMKKVYFA